MGVKSIRTPVDRSCGHCFPPVVPVSGSSDVFVDQFMCTRLSDRYVKHCCGSRPVVCHLPVAAQGSATVFVNGLADHCASHRLSCGDFACNGSSDVYNGY